MNPILPSGKRQLALDRRKKWAISRQRLSLGRGAWPASSELVPPAARRAIRAGAAFTLVELLVVIGCIALLASLLLPSLQAAQSKARRIHCAANLRQLGVALKLYVDENGFYPLAMSTNSLGAWQHALWPSAADQVLYCPQLIPASPQFLEYFPTNQTIFPHYGYNASGAVEINPPPQNPGLGGSFVWTGPGMGNYAPASENWVRVPSNMIAIGDGMTFLPPPLLAATLSPTDPLYNIFPIIMEPQGYPGANKNHANGANMIFCDAHVEYAKQSAWLDPGDENQRRWNADNQSHPSFQ